MHPELKTFIERAVVPALLEQFLRDHREAQPGLTAEQGPATPGTIEASRQPGRSREDARGAATPFTELAETV